MSRFLPVPATLAVFLGLSLPAARAQPADVAVVLTPHKTYQETAGLIERALAAAGHRPVLVTLPAGDSEEEGSTETQAATQRSPDQADPQARQALESLSAGKVHVAITLGSAASQLVLESVNSIPVIACMLTNALDDPLTAADHPHAQRLVALSAGVHPAEQVKLIRLIQPSARNIGLPFSDRSRRTAEAVQAEANRSGLRLTLIRTDRDAFPQAMEELVSRGCDGVLMIPDAQVYNLASVKRVLLWGIRQKKPVYAFSENLVKAGALTAVYSTPADIARQVAALVDRVRTEPDFLKSGLQYPDRARRAVNVRTAEVIGLSVPKAVMDRMDGRYGGE